MIPSQKQVYWLTLILRIVSFSIWLKLASRKIPPVRTESPKQNPPVLAAKNIPLVKHDTDPKDQWSSEPGRKSNSIMPVTWNIPWYLKGEEKEIISYYLQQSTHLNWLNTENAQLPAWSQEKWSMFTSCEIQHCMEGLCSALCPCSCPLQPGLSSQRHREGSQLHKREYFSGCLLRSNKALCADSLTPPGHFQGLPGSKLL